jgi:TetR/AcrR family transcriptional regulator
MKHQRAIDAAEKNERRMHILQTAAALFETAGYDQISMSEVAFASGIAKGTVYLYFKTKEELFLALIDVAFGHWFADLQLRLTTIPDCAAPQRIAVFTAMLTESIHQQALLLGLLPILHTVLEHNIPYAAALEFKQHLRDHLLQTGAQIETGFNFLRIGQGAELLLTAYAGLIGLQSMAEPSEVVRQVLGQPEMDVLVVDETAALRQMVSRIFTGMYYENER